MNSPTKICRWHVAVLMAILVLAASLRCFNLSGNSLWSDEYLSLECSSGWARSDGDLAGEAAAAPDLINLDRAKPWSSIWSSVGSDENHPPVYFIVLRFWRVCFGDSPAALRSLSVVASIVAITLLFFIGCRLHSPEAALWACLLMALAGPQIEQSQDARAYMPMIAVCLAAALGLIRLDTTDQSFSPNAMRDTANCALLTIASLTAPLMHYMAFAFITALLLYSTIYMKSRARRLALYSVSSALAIYVLVWGRYLVQQHFRMIDNTAWMIDTQAHHTSSVLVNLCDLPARFFINLDGPKQATFMLGAVLFFVPIILMRYRAAALCLFWLGVPIGGIALVDLCTARTSLSMVKYTLIAAPAMYLLLGMLAMHLRTLGWIPAMLLCLSAAMTVPGVYESSLPDYRELSRFVSRSSRPADPVIFVAGTQRAFSAELVLSIDYYLASQHRPIYILQRTPPPELVAKLKTYRHVCVVADGLKSLDNTAIPGLSIDRAELLNNIAIVGIADPPATASRYARATFPTDPNLREFLHLR